MLVNGCSEINMPNEPVLYKRSHCNWFLKSYKLALVENVCAQMCSLKLANTFNTNSVFPHTSESPIQHLTKKNCLCCMDDKRFWEAEEDKFKSTNREIQKHPIKETQNYRNTATQTVLVCGWQAKQKRSQFKPTNQSLSFLERLSLRKLQRILNCVCFKCFIFIS